MLNLLSSLRAHDRGPNADPANSGYNRLIFAPGMEVAHGANHVYADVEVPFWQDMNGNQLVAAPMLKVAVSRSF